MLLVTFDSGVMAEGEDLAAVAPQCGGGSVFWVVAGLTGVVDGAAASWSFALYGEGDECGVEMGGGCGHGVASVACLRHRKQAPAS